MAKKEFTKGEVINIFGKVVAKGVDYSGRTVFLLSKGMANLARGIFWVAGKHVDMVTTIKEIRRHDAIEAEVVDEKPAVISMDEFAAIPEKIAPIQQALEYAESAFANSTLPKEEILKIDTQGLLMAQAIKNVIEQIQPPALKSEGKKTAEAFIKACSMFIEYHQSGSERHKIKAGKLLEAALESKEQFIQAVAQMGKETK